MIKPCSKCLTSFMIFASQNHLDIFSCKHDVIIIMIIVSFKSHSSEFLCVSFMTGEPQFNSLKPRPNRRHFADDIFKCIFENENECISPRISLKFVPKVRINNIPALVQIMAWRRPGDKPLSEPMMVSLLTHICVTRPQWVKFIRILTCTTVD